MEGAWEITLVLFQVWLSIVVGLIMLPAMFGVSLGFTDLYIKVLVKTLEVKAKSSNFKRYMTINFFPYLIISK